jgi:hypothetical protein
MDAVGYITASMWMPAIGRQRTISSAVNLTCLGLCFLATCTLVRTEDESIDDSSVVRASIGGVLTRIVGVLSSRPTDHKRIDRARQVRRCRIAY